MVAAIVGLVIVGALFVGPLVWRVWLDRRQERAMAVRAQAHAAVVRALGGESLVAISVEAPAAWRPGRIVVSAPSDWRFLLEQASNALVRQVPAHYELVVRPLTADASHAGYTEAARAA